MDPAYTQSICDLCEEDIEPTDTSLYLQFTLSPPLSRSGSITEHEGHICEVCDDVDEVLGLSETDAAHTIRFHFALDENRTATCLSLEVATKHGQRWRIPPANLSQELRELAQLCIERSPGTPGDEADLF